MKNILIVEDEKIIALDIKNAVQKYGYNVIGSVTSGEDAVEFCKRSLPDIILMDIHLDGEMDGIDAALAIKENLEIPVIFLTVSVDSVTLERAKKVEPYGYINKPVKDVEIFTTLEMALHKFRTELKLRQNEQWLSAMLNGIGEGIISVDIDGVITFMNRIAEKMTGWIASDAIGKHKNEILIKESADQKKKRIAFDRTARNSLLVMLQNYILKSKYGKEVPVDINNSTILDDDGEITGNIYTIRDITERKKKEEIIRNAAEEWRVTFDSLTDSIFLVNEDGEVIRCNNEATLVLKKEYNDIVGYSVRKLFGQSGDYIYSCFLEIKEELETRIFEQRMGDNWYEGKFDPIIDKKEEFTGAVIILSDISEKKRAQQEIEKYKNHLEELVEIRTEELKQVNKDLENEISLRWLIAEQMVQMKEYAEAASKSKSEFLANMSHELRTPLNSIIGFAKLLKMGIDPEDSAQYIGNIITSGEHLLSMINDILNLSKMEAGKLKIERKKSDIIQVSAVSMDIVSIQAENKDINLSMSREFEERELFVFADEKRIQQVMLNLLSNAIKFTDAGGKVTVNIRKNSKTCYVDVIDNGCGIDKDMQKTIFDKFNQVDNSLNKRNEGTGLGLAISKSLIESHFGHFYVLSEPGQGSTFTFSLPVYDSEKHEDSLSSLKNNYPQILKEKRLLFILNSQKQITTCVEFMTTNGQEYTILKRSTVSGEALKKDDIGAIVVETAENIGNEQKFVELIKAMNNVPVIAISSTLDMNYKEVFLSMGYDLFYLIPVDYLEIVNDLSKIYGEKR
ncbi:MAG TPA: ATP-binding protein [Spirochaetota bacterium]|nr:ATP-binding protein [Spirochaetota bacterium]